MLIFTPVALWKNNVLNIQKSVEAASKRDDKRLHVAFDCNSIPREDKKLLKSAVTCLKWLSESNYCNLFFYSCVDNIGDWVKWGKAHGISFAAFNQNPEVQGPQYAMKPYYDVIIDAHSGFNIEYWKIIDKVFHKAFVALHNQKLNQTGDGFGTAINAVPVIPPLDAEENEVENFKIADNGTEFIYNGTKKYDLEPDPELIKKRKTQRIQRELAATHPTLEVPTIPSKT